MEKKNFVAAEVEIITTVDVVTTSMPDGDDLPPSDIPV